MNILLFLAVLPSIVLGFIVYKYDKIEKEPGSLLVKLFFGGIGSVILTLIITAIYQAIIPGYEDFSSSSTLGILIDAYLGVALIEEGTKLFFVKLISWKDKNFDYLYDGIVYAVFVSLGFATLENILYVVSGGIGIALLRMIISVPGHVFFAIAMGYFYSLAKVANINNNNKLEVKNKVLMIVVPVLLHGTFDFLLFVGSIPLAIVFFIFVIVLYIISFRKIIQLSKIRSSMYVNQTSSVQVDKNLTPTQVEPQQNSQVVEKINLNKKYCTNCGTYVEHYNFCPRCGTKK